MVAEERELLAPAARPAGIADLSPGADCNGGRETRAVVGGREPPAPAVRRARIKPTAPEPVGPPILAARLGRRRRSEGTGAAACGRPEDVVAKPAEPEPTTGARPETIVGVGLRNAGLFSHHHLRDQWRILSGTREG